MRREAVTPERMGAWIASIQASSSTFDPESAPLWRSLPTPFEGFGVTRDGRVFRVSPYRELIQRKHKSGYHVVNLGKACGVKVHRLVYLAYHGPKPSHEHLVRHLNGNREDNRADNLAWGTASDNFLDTCLHAAIDVLDILKRHPELRDARLKAPVRDLLSRAKEFR